MRIDGKILWFDQRDGNGIIVDDTGNEYYVDTSVVVPRGVSVNFKSGTLVSFQINESIPSPLCACVVTLRGTK